MKKREAIRNTFRQRPLSLITTIVVKAYRSILSLFFHHRTVTIIKITCDNTYI